MPKLHDELTRRSQYDYREIVYPRKRMPVERYDVLMRDRYYNTGGAWWLSKYTMHFNHAINPNRYISPTIEWRVVHAKTGEVMAEGIGPLAEVGAA